MTHTSLCRRFEANIPATNDHLHINTRFATARGIAFVPSALSLDHDHAVCTYAIPKICLDNRGTKDFVLFFGPRPGSLLLESRKQRRSPSITHIPRRYCFVTPSSTSNGALRWPPDLRGPLTHDSRNQGQLHAERAQARTDDVDFFHRTLYIP